MQVGIVLAMAWWDVVIASVAFSLSALVALWLFLIFKDVCNGSCAIGEHDPNWALYQREVPRWIPRRRAWTLPQSAPSRRNAAGDFCCLGAGAWPGGAPLTLLATSANLVRGGSHDGSAN
jgi:hypothetical protein